MMFECFMLDPIVYGNITLSNLKKISISIETIMCTKILGDRPTFKVLFVFLHAFYHF